MIDLLIEYTPRFALKYIIKIQCSYTVHGGIRVFARSCCADQSQTTLNTSPSNDGAELVVDLCREDWDFRIFFLISAICAILCLLMIAVSRMRNGLITGPFFSKY